MGDETPRISEIDQESVNIFIPDHCLPNLPPIRWRHFREVVGSELYILEHHAHLLRIKARHFRTVAPNEALGFRIHQIVLIISQFKSWVIETKQAMYAGASAAWCSDMSDRLKASLKLITANLKNIADQMFSAAEKARHFAEYENCLGGCLGTCICPLPPIECPICHLMDCAGH